MHLTTLLDEFMTNKTYSHPATQKEFRDALNNLKRGEAWRELCTSGHEAVALLNEVTALLKENE